jgi:hypothetical protein
MNETIGEMSPSGRLVKKIWSLCHILRGDGVSYHEYIPELTYLLFLKIAEETGTETALPHGYRWRDLVDYDGSDLLTFYRDMLTYLGGHAENPTVQQIYAFPTTVFSHSENLRAVIDPDAWASTERACRNAKSLSESDKKVIIDAYADLKRARKAAGQ